MIFITSLAPSHKNYESQKAAVGSWRKSGYEIISVNSAEEINELKKDFNITFYQTKNTGEADFTRPYVRISAILECFKANKKECAFIINSDILIKNNPVSAIQEFIKLSNKGLVLFNRYDFSTDISNASIFRSGFDGFILNKKWASILPESKLCLGQCHWDYWLPYLFYLKNIPIYRPREKFLFHKKHKLQYSREFWVKTASIFQKEIGALDNNIANFKDLEKMSNYVYRKINMHIR